MTKSHRMLGTDDPVYLALFFSKIQMPASIVECWTWVGTRSPGNYGYITRPGARGSATAHRVSYALAFGEAPAGLHVDHLCRNHSCVNPLHLEAVTPAMNTARSSIAAATVNRAKTHCPTGHLYSPDNTRLTNRGTNRQCKACNLAVGRRRGAKNRRMVPNRMTPKAANALMVGVDAGGALENVPAKVLAALYHFGYAENVCVDRVPRVTELGRQWVATHLRPDGSIVTVVPGQVYGDLDKRRDRGNLRVVEVRFSAKMGRDVAACVDDRGWQTEIAVARLGVGNYKLVKDVGSTTIPEPTTETFGDGMRHAHCTDGTCCTVRDHASYQRLAA